jgi:hypothetical protein
VRPTVSEQLAGMRRILADVIAPEISGAYPADMLRGVLANLEMLERSSSKVGPFLVWDNAGTERLLESIAPMAGESFTRRVEAVLLTRPADHVDVEALDAHNTALRDLLADAIPMLAEGGQPTLAAYAAVRAHLRERIDRFPLAMNAPMPSAPR